MSSLLLRIGGEIGSPFLLANFVSLKKYLLKTIGRYQRDSSSRLGGVTSDYYMPNYEANVSAAIELPSGFGEGFPDSEAMKSLNKKTLYSQIIKRDNFVSIRSNAFSYEASPHVNKLVVKTGAGDDIVSLGTSGESDNDFYFKSIRINTGTGDDIIGTYSKHYANYPNGNADLGDPPDIAYQSGAGKDIFYGVPQGAIAVVKDFNIKKDSIGLNGFTRRYKLFEVDGGVALVDRRHRDGMLLLEGVENKSDVNIISEALI